MSEDSSGTSHPTEEELQQWQKESELREALSSLLRGEGLTPGKIQQTRPGLVLSLGVDTSQDVYNLIRDALSHLKPDKYTDALRNAFGDENSPTQLTERRKQFGAKHGGVSEDTVRRWEDAAIGLLADQLMSTTEGRTFAKPKNDDPVLTALLGIRQALVEQTAILREISNQLKRRDA